MATHSCSCLENPRDRGAWWAAVYGVAQSQTRLKQLSSSSIYIYIYMCVCVCICMYIYIYRLPRWLSSGLENPMDREAWQATVLKGAKSDTTEAT